ncbi:MAG: hypothetical protein GX361_06835 [Bacteroidales bacterium]|nr:hypothetical protein [Bacteroidales bacterium]
MKTKIIAILLLTFLLVGTSVLIMNKSIKKMIVSEATLPSFGEASVLADYEDFDTDNVVKVPAYTGSSSYVQSSYNSNLGSTFYDYSVLPVSNDEGISVGSVYVHGHSIGQGMSNRKRGNNLSTESSPISSPMIAMSYPRHIQAIDKNRSFSSGTISDRRDVSQTQLTQPFSDKAAVPGPMRAIGEFPPAEGAPVGEGLPILILLSGAYMYFRRKI